MHRIILISTRHDECGFCTIDGLYTIINMLSPDIIFEEIPPSFFDKYYVTKVCRNLETDAISKYLENYNIPHIPVDSDNVPPDSFFEDLKYMFERVEGLTDINGFNYRTFSDRNSKYAKMYGFQYFNSNHCIGIQNEIDDAIEKSLQKINDEKLYQTHKKWKDVNDERENKMLQNIYNYSKDHIFENAIFTLGFAHRKSIMQKIPKYEETTKIKLNWNFI